MYHIFQQKTSFWVGKYFDMCTVKKMFHKSPFFVPHQKQVHDSATQISVQGLYWLYLMDIDKVGF